METTLGALLARRALELRHAAGPLDPGRPLRWVAVSELADPTPYLEGGELLLTTGLDLVADDGAAVDAYVARIARRGVVALGIGTGLRHATVPPALAAAAQRAAVPLLDVPRHIPFIAVTRAVADLVGQAEREEVSRSLDAHRRLARAATREDGERAVLREVARLLDGWAAVTGADGEVEGSAGSVPDDVPVLLRSEVERLAPQGQRGASSVSSSGGAVVVHPLGVSGAPRGFLAAGRAEAFGRPARTAVAAAVALLSLARQRTDAEVEGRRRLLGAAARLLVAGRAEVARELLALADGAPEEVLVAVVTGADGVGAVLPPGAMAVCEAEAAVVLGPPSVIPQVLAAVGGHGPTGVSRAVALVDVPRAVAEGRAARIAAAGPADVVRFEQLLARGLPGLVDEGVARTWAAQLLAPLVAESATGADLIGSLHTWLAHHGQLQPAAADLGVHRHTLRARMARVEQLLGRPLASPQTRMDLWFALQRR